MNSYIYKCNGGFVSGGRCALHTQPGCDIFLHFLGKEQEHLPSLSSHAIVTATGLGLKLPLCCCYYHLN